MFSRKDLFKLIVPLIIEQILTVIVGLVDSIMVSHVGEAAVSGVSLVDSINILLIGLFGALATGGAVVAAQFLGQKKSKEACVAGEQLEVAVLGLSIILMIVALLFGNTILQLLYGKVDSDVMEYARTYLFYSALAFPLIALYNSSASLFRTMGNSFVSMKVSLAMNIIHVIMNATFIYGLGLGVKGAAISTLISRTFAAVTLLILLKNKKHLIHIGKLKDYRIDLCMIKKILRIGVPNGLENSIFQIGKILVQGIVAGLGTSSITAYSVANTLAGIGVLPGAAIGLSLITVIGQCMGAGDYDGVKIYTKKLLKVSYIIMGFLNLFLLILAPFILKIYHFSPETTKIATIIIIYHCVICSIIWPLSFALPNALRATNDVQFTMIVSIFSMWTWRIAACYILVVHFNLGVLGVFIAMTIDWLFRSICFVLRFRKERYRRIVSVDL